MSSSVPYGAGQQGVEGVEPLVHVLVVVGLQQDSSVLRTHSKRVRGLETQKQLNPHIGSTRLLIFRVCLRVCVCVYTCVYV